MKCVKSLEIYSPQNFVDILTGYCYIFESDNITSTICALLKRHDIVTHDYPLDAIDTIVSNNLSVVLVDTSYVDDDCNLVYEYRWFEVPESFNKEI